MLNRLLAVCLLAGLLAGLALAVLQGAVTTPMIFATEMFEARDAADLPASIEPHFAHMNDVSNAAFSKPADGLQRIVFTSLATVATSIGFCMILLAVMLVAGEPISARQAFGWGVAALVAIGLAPALGLPPILPGSLAGPLLARQIWWLVTACVTGSGLWRILRSGNLGRGLAGIGLLVAPHINGAPKGGAYNNSVPGALAARFAGASLAIQSAMWILSGFMVGTLWVWFGQRRTA